MSDEELKVQDAIVNGLIDHYKAVIEQYKAENSEDKIIRRTLENFMRGLWEEIQVGELEYTTSEVYEMLEREIFTDNHVAISSKDTETQGDDRWLLHFGQNKAIPSAEPCEYAISREEAKQFLYERIDRLNDDELYDIFSRIIDDMYNDLPSIKSQEPEWIPVSERLPKDLEPVNVTWVNHNPESYYADIKDKPFTATGVYFNGQWYWWSTLCTDILAEYSHNYDDIIDGDIEIIAWMPLPKPYEPQESEE